MADRDEVEELSDLLESLPTRSREDKKVDEVEKNEDVSSKEQAKKKIWEKMQEEMKSELIEEDSAEVQSWNKEGNAFSGLHHIAGVDISFEKDRPNHACAMLTVLSFPTLEVLHVSSAVVEMTEPYIPGFLAFREVGFLQERLDAVKQDHPDFLPQVIFVDGNGILHPQGFGLASHLGVLCDIPCIGVGKKLFHVDGLEKGQQHKEQVAKELLKKGDYFLLRGESGKIWGAALRTSDGAINPVYVSVGHKISLEMAIKLTMVCSIKRIPEPIRQADLLSRDFLRTHKPQK